MIHNRQWKNLLLFCAGLTLGSAFCMKWMESDFIFEGNKFDIVGIELFYDQQKLVTLFNGIDQRVATILSYHLYFDFAFMTGVYPGIAAICMLGYHKGGKGFFRSLLLFFAFMQVVAFALDIAENFYLLQWLNTKVVTQQSIQIVHIVASAKWIIALLGFFTGLAGIIFRKRQTQSDFSIS